MAGLREGAGAKEVVCVRETADRERSRKSIMAYIVYWYGPSLASVSMSEWDRAITVMSVMAL